ncbi:MAG: DUF349 domain-containing protein [Balneolaceae bacterium]
MSEEKKISKATETETNNLFENDYVYVSPEGDVVLKKTSFFDERKLTTVDAESAEEQIKAFELAFKNIESKVENYFQEWSGKVADQTEDAEEAFKNLTKEITSADAVGDFEGLIKNAEARLEELKEKAKSAVEPETESVESSDTEPSNDGEKGDVETYYKELAEKAEALMDLTDWAYVSMEFDNIDNNWGEGPDPEGVDISGYRKKIDELRVQFEEKKQAHYEEQKKRREQNLEKKNELLTELKKIVDEEKWTFTKEVGKIKGKWERVKSVPADKAEELEKKFEKLLATFDEHKVDRIVKKMQQEEDNLTGKLVILEKMESFLKDLDDDSNWKELEDDFEKLSKQFRKIGKVPVEKNQEIWNRYHGMQDTFHSMRFKHDKAYRNQIETFLSKKKKLIDQAEALIDADDLADAARRVNKLHRKWKKVGNLPQKDENEMWDRFKEATDKFNEKKADNLDVLRDQEQENLDEKMELIKKAEDIQDSDDWEDTHREMQRLMDKWKKVGPVARRQSGKIWKKFKGAMDHFYDRRRDHFKEVKEERKDNLKEKEDVLDQLKALRDHEDPISAVEEAKPLQEEFKKAGYVPIKHKNRMWKEYREVCDVIYDRFRAAKAAVDVVGRKNIDNFSSDDIDEIRKMKSESSKLYNQIKKMQSELVQKKESLSYFKPSGKSSPLLDEVNQNIENLENKLAEKEDRLAEIEKKIDLVKKEND